MDQTDACPAARRIHLPGFLASVILVLMAAVRVAAASEAQLPPDEVLRLIEEASSLESGGKSSLDSSPIHVTADSLHSYDAIHYRLDVKPSRISRFVEGKVTLTLVVRDAGFTQVDLDGIAMTFSAVKVNGNPRATWTTSNGKLFVPVCEGLDCPPHAPGDTLVVEVSYSCSPTAGYYYYVRNSYTVVEPNDAKHWWPCYDQPYDKAALDLYATVPASDSCYSNGLLIDVVPGTPGLRVWHWRETHPISTYLVSIAVSQYWQWKQFAGPLTILNVAFPEDSTKAKLDYANVPAMVMTFSALWAPYPFDKYGQATVEPFNAGGMEHQTMTTLRRNLLRGDKFYEYVFAHELAHQWWGDWVTCVDFRDIWLNEGFATFGEAQWVEQFYSAAKYDSAIAQHMTSALASDLSFRYAIYDPPAGFTFGNTIYKKGGSVLHMLRRVLGDGPFYAGLQLYGQRYAYGNATTRDFQHAMEDASGQPLDWFFDEWIFAAGIPTYDWTWQTAPADPPAPGQTDVGLFVRQVQTLAPLYKMPIEFKFTRSALPDTFVTVWNDAVASQEFAVRVNGTVTGVTLDPRNSILKRVQTGTVNAGRGLDLGAGRLALTVMPNPARGPVALRGAWLGTVAAAPLAARFRVYDASGRLVRDLGEVPRTADGGSSGAPFVVTWDRTDDRGRIVAPGLYFAQVTAGVKNEARPVVITP